MVKVLILRPVRKSVTSSSGITDAAEEKVIATVPPFSQTIVPEVCSELPPKKGRMVGLNKQDKIERR